MTETRGRGMRKGHTSFDKKSLCEKTTTTFTIFFFFILPEIRVKKAQAPYTFVCVPVFVHLQNADFVLTSPLRLSQHYRLAGLLRLNPIRFCQEGQIATQESTALFALYLTWVVRDLPALVHL